jgi:hypothetical protein
MLLIGIQIKNLIKRELESVCFLHFLITLFMNCFINDYTGRADVVFYMRFCIALIGTIALLCLPISSQAQEGKHGDVTVIVKSSPFASFESRLHLNNQRLVKEIEETKPIHIERIPELPLAFIELRINEKNTVEYMVSYSGNLFLPKDGVKIVPSQKTKELITSYIRILSKHHYGKPLTWQEANTVFPRKATAEVIDLETGLRFDVQRRAGSLHADVQPLTAKDTKVMKKIYNGRWSWKRRSILIRVDGQCIAASMHGMPHGGGAITWNNFPGHFCIHFKESTTHRRDYPDPGHDLMISKASGNLHQRIVEGEPRELVSMFLAAVNEQDKSVIRLMLNQHEQGLVTQLITQIDEVELVKLLSNGGEEKVNFQEVTAEVPVQIQLKKRGERAGNKSITFLLTRGSALERWKLELDPLFNELFTD